MDRTNINKELLNKCITESFSGQDEDIDDNTLLKEDHEKFKNEAIQIWPSILINNKIYKIRLIIFHILFFKIPKLIRELWILT